MFRIAGISSATEPTVEGDDLVPLMVEWRFGSCLYLRLVRSGGAGAWIELKLDPRSGERIGLTPEDLPQRRDADVLIDADREAGEDVVPISSLSEFRASDDLSPAARFLDVEGRPTRATDGRVELIEFGNAAADRWVNGGPVRFGYTTAGDLVALAPRPSTFGGGVHHLAG